MSALDRESTQATTFLRRVAASMVAAIAAAIVMSHGEPALAVLPDAPAQAAAIPLSLTRAAERAKADFRAQMNPSPIKIMMPDTVRREAGGPSATMSCVATTPPSTP